MPESSNPPQQPSADPLACVAFVLAAAAAASGIAAILARAIGFPGTELLPDVVGLLATSGSRKPVECGLFYYTVILAPCFAVFARRIAARLLDTNPAAGGVLIASSAAAIVACVVARVRAEAALTTDLAPIGLLAAGAIAILTWPVAARGLAVARAAIGDGAHRVPVATAGISLAVFLLSVGARIPGDLPLASAAIRVGGVVAGCVLIAFGIALALESLLPRPGDSSERSEPAGIGGAFRHGTWLLLARFAADDPRVVGASVGACVLGFGYEIARTRWRPPAAFDAGRAGRFLDHVFLPVLVLALTFHRDVDGAIDLFHAGEWLTPAYEVFLGERPFADVYLQHGLIQNVLRNDWTFALLSPTFEANRLSENLAYALAHAAAFVLAARIFRSRWLALLFALAMASPGLFFGPRLIAPFLALACVASCGARQRDPSGAAVKLGADRVRLALAGVCCAVATFWSLDAGVYAAGAIVTFLALRGLRPTADDGDGVEVGDPVASLAVRGDGGWRQCLAFACGGLIGSAPFVIDLVRRDALLAAISNSAAQVRLQLSVWGKPFPDLTAVLAAPGGLVSPALVAMIAAVTFIATIALWFARSSSRAPSRFLVRTLLIALGGIFWFRTALGRSDDGHLQNVAPFFWLIAFAAAEQAWRRCMRASWPGSLRFIAGAAPAALLAAWLVVAFVPLYALAQQWIRLGVPTDAAPPEGFAHPPIANLGDVSIPRSQAQALATLDQFLAENLGENETFFDFANMGGVYFLLGRRCPSRFVMAAYAATNALQDEAIADLERERPRLVIGSAALGMERVDRLPMSARTPRLAEYLHSRYGEPRVTDFGWVCRRLDD